MRDVMHKDLVAPLSVGLAQDKTLSRDAGDDEFLRYAGKCAERPCSVVLLSGGEPVRDGENRYSIATWDPYIELKSKSNRCTLRMLGREASLEADPLSLLDKVSACLKPEFSLVAAPFSGGAIGYFAYELKNSIERLPQTACDDLSLPELLLYWPRKILIHDRLNRELRLLVLAPQGETQTDDSPLDPLSSNEALFKVGTLRSNFSREAYIKAVNDVRCYIAKGDAYQVNLSQRYRFSFEGDPFRLWRSLFALNPAAFYAHINAGDHWVLSTSMERFLYRKGSYIETRPIKGTRKRGKDQKEDDLLKRDLATSRKDDAELSMIVDLLRNDLGRVCTPRSIRVREHKRLETYQNVHHLVSIVTGELHPETTGGDLIRATFPGGSITGCPKIRAMEIIDELEPNVRHVYTGAIGYLGWHDNLDLNIAIRTGIIHQGTCYYSVGGGIVFDSLAEDEYKETLEKGRTLFELIERIGKRNA